MQEFLLKLMRVSNPDQLDYLSSKYFQEIPFIHLYSKDRQGKYLVSNNLHAKSVGYKNGPDLFGLTDRDFCVADSASILRNNDERVIMQEAPILYTEYAKTLNDDEFNLISYKFPLRSCANKVIGIIGVSIIAELNGQCFLDMKLNLNFNKSDRYQSDSYQELKEIYGLSTREIDCLYCLAKGMTAKQTAGTLKLSKRTVENYLVSIKVKLDCESRSELVNKALKMRYIRNKLFS